MKFGVIVFPGSNCDHDAYHAISKHIGQPVDFIWHRQTSLDGYDAVIVPGGFSYGDYLRCGALAKFSPIMKAVKEFAAQGKFVFGICNGFQILCEAGLLPGALIRNRDLHFICDHVNLRVENNKTPYTNEIEALLNAQQLSASADIFKRMVRDVRQNPELRDTANIINDIAKRAPNNSPDINLWREVQATVKDISQEISASGREDSDAKGKEKDGDEKIIGNVNWTGTIDHDVNLIIRGNIVEVQTLSGTPYNDATFSFTSPLPKRNVVIEIEKRKARGSVQLIQQPNQANNYTAIIRIRDKDGGAKVYELEIYWK